MKCLQSKNTSLEQDNEQKQRIILVLEDNLMESNQNLEKQKNHYENELKIIVKDLNQKEEMLKQTTREIKNLKCDLDNIQFKRNQI